MEKKKKVLLGMSGGVDSSAAAILLKRQGYEVCGCTMRLYGGGNEESRFSSSDGAADAKNVCVKIGIEHIILNFSEEFKGLVMKPFAESYISGETPNPCIECNRHMKFGLMLKKAELMGFDYIATGHYAQISYDVKTGKYQLCRPKDRRKDQTYVLYFLTQYQMAHTLFPLYGMEKSEIRKLAEENGLVNSRKPDSQDICFVPDGDYAVFIKRFSGYVPQKGDFIDESGAKLGMHSGIINYTVGQRRGLGITFGRPVFVTNKNSLDNTVTLGEEGELFKDTLYLKNVNIISGEEISAPMKVTAKARYNAADRAAVLYPPENGLSKIVFESPVRAPAAGQSCVFYDGGIVLGGGIIRSVN